MARPSVLITSRANPLVKQVRALARRKEREQAREFVVEGIQPVMQALQSGAEIHRLLVAPDLLKSKAALAAVQQAEARGIRIERLSSEIFEDVAERANPTGLAALVGMPRRTLDDLAVTPESVFVVLHEIGNPGNLGTMLRTVDAIGGSGVLTIGESTDPYHPTAVKASRGALFSVPTVHVASADELISWAATRKLPLVTASDKGAALCWEADLRPPLALVLGSEGRGLPPAVFDAGRLSVRIPMNGVVDSLNLAVAAGVLLYEVYRQNRRERTAYQERA